MSILPVIIPIPKLRQPQITIIVTRDNPSGNSRFNIFHLEFN